MGTHIKVLKWHKQPVTGWPFVFFSSLSSSFQPAVPHCLINCHICHKLQLNLSFSPATLSNPSSALSVTLCETHLAHSLEPLMFFFAEWLCWEHFQKGKTTFCDSTAHLMKQYCVCFNKRMAEDGESWWECLDKGFIISEAACDPQGYCWAAVTLFDSILIGICAPDVCQHSIVCS